MIAIAAVAFTPARYVYLHFAHSPSRRDVIQPAEALGWRTTGQLIGSVVALFILAGVAAFMFTPAAEKLVLAPRFWPVLLAGSGAAVLLMVLRGFALGRTTPLVKGLYDAYEREAQPAKYWASMTWNAVLGGLLLWVGYQLNKDASAQMLGDRCFHATDLEYLHQQLSACDEWISLRPLNPDAYMQRGLLHLDTNAFDKAAADFTRAHELVPDNPWPLASRGLVWALANKDEIAEADFEVVRSIDDENPALLQGEAVLKRNNGDLQGAVDRLTKSMKQDPDNLWALRMRSELYWELGEIEKSARDDRRWLELKDAGVTGVR